MRTHRLLALVGAVALLLWGGSALLHPLMAAFGPQAVQFFPPAVAIDLQGSKPLAEILREAGVEPAHAVRLVPGEHGALWQVTAGQDQPRRYFRPEDGTEIADGDRAQAVWLARHYLAQPNMPLERVEWVDRFSESYPAVNRLLPVWRVRFQRDDGLEALIYTETGSVAAVSDHWKEGVQAWFQRIHTWSFLSGRAETARIVLIFALVGTVALMALTGVALLFNIRRRARAPGSRHWHRTAAYILALPLLMFSFSGLWHLLQNGWEQPERVLRLSPPVVVGAADFGLHQQWASISDGLDVAGVSLVMAADGRRLYRLALAPDRAGGPQGAGAIRNARFDGVQPTGPALYLDARTGLPWAPGDREMALQLGERFTGLPRTAILSAELVTRFGPSYDFRNKRLPVWRLEYGPPVKAQLFVDTAGGVLADRVVNRAIPERIGFSMLHKWNFLMMFGRDVQNIVMALVVAALMIFIAGIGLQMELKRRRIRAVRR